MSEYVVVDLDSGTVTGTNLAIIENFDIDDLSDSEIIDFATEEGEPLKPFLAEFTRSIMRSTHFNRKDPIHMDVIDTPSTDLVILDADTDETESPSFGMEVTKTLAISTATSAVVFGGFVVAAKLLPKAKAWFDARGKKTDVVDGEVATDTPVTETPKTKKD